MAAEQPPSPTTGTRNSLKLQFLQVPGCSKKLWCDTSQGRLRFLVLPSWRQRVFSAIQGLSHPSGRAMLAIVSRNYIWDGLWRDVLAWARACEVCACSKIAQHTKPPVLPIPDPTARFDHVHVDFVGPFPKDQEFRYVLTMMDRTTPWPEAVPIKDVTSNTILQAFINPWIARFGVPRTVMSDRGAQFTSQAWAKFLTGWGILVSTTTAYHPQASGLVERFHSSLKNALRCAAPASNSWTRLLLWVLLGLRNAPRSNTATSAAEVLYGTPVRIPGLCFRQEVPTAAPITRQLQLARENISNYQPPHLDPKKFKYSPFVAADLRKCDFVYLRDDTLAKLPLAPRYTGLYPVLRKSWGNNTFSIRVGNREEVVSLGRLKAATLTS